MLKRGAKHEVEDTSQKRVSLDEFLRAYNETVPEAFPRASARILKEFQDANPSLFKDTKEWTIDKHRKKFMDWISSYQKNQ